MLNPKHLVILFFISGAFTSNLAHANTIEVHSSNQQPRVLDVNLADSDLLIEQGELFSITFEKAIVGHQPMDASEKQRLLDRVRVHYDPQSGELKVTAPRIIIGRVIAKLKITTNQPLALKLSGEDGNVKLQNMEVAFAKVKLEDGDILVKNVKFFSPSIIQTADGDIQMIMPIAAREVQARSKGDGEIQIPAPWPAAEPMGLLQLQTYDGDIRVL